MKSIRSTPRNHAAEGDERIRTAARCFCTSESERLQTASGYIYFLQDPFSHHGPIKVGYSTDPFRRCSHINRLLKHGGGLVVRAAFPGDRSEERELHRRWREHRILGEWFRPAAAIVGAVELCRVLYPEFASGPSGGAA